MAARHSRDLATVGTAPRAGVGRSKRRSDWGTDGLQTRLAASWRNFLDGIEGWLRIVRGRGPEAVERVYRETLEGRIKPDEGSIVSLWEE